MLLGLCTSLAGCGEVAVPETSGAASDSVSAQSAPPVPPALGEWMIQGWEHGFMAPNSPYWIDDVRLATSGKTKIFSGTMGCGLSNCSGFEITGVKGTWSIHGTAAAQRMDFTFDGQTQRYSYQAVANSGGAALVFTMLDDIFGDPGSFTMYLVSE